MSRSRKKHAGCWIARCGRGDMKRWKRQTHKSLRNFEKKMMYHAITSDEDYFSLTRKYEYSCIWASPSDGSTYAPPEYRNEDWYIEIIRK